MATIILGLGALTIVLGYVVRVKDKKIQRIEDTNCALKDILDLRKETYTSDIDFLEEKHAAEKESWKQTSSAWILEKEEIIERLTNQLFNRGKEYAEFKFGSNEKIKELEQEKFDQLHELAIMLNDSYNLDKVIEHKAFLHDHLLHNSNRKQRREFIEKGYIEL